MTWRLRPIVVAGLLAGVPVGVATAAASLSKVVLRGAQVGPGYVLKLRPDSHGVSSTVTLDMCGTTFHSEGLRTARLQVNYSKRGSQLGVSNEVVTYHGTGAQLAMNEIRRSVADCPKTPVGSAIAGVGKLTYRITHIAKTHGLLPGAIALLMHISGTIKAHHLTVTQAVVYERYGNVLSGIYGNGRPLVAQAQLVLHAAAESAINLHRYAAR